ncbi:hypothetical protein MLC59_18705 [Marinobacter bryozoorum]|uniref:hypothetical protein n=1 Tax=Marinobacter bryozoorum TaxID=256324 RepID=UPI0020049D15|nr:hypothetical protein [Marinobacter bryozoorum]MCK7546192.1 hypothetical protein [Marinobacter bryozoorum]
MEWVAYTNTTGGGYDGLDFTISKGYELMEFKLNSNLLSYLSEQEVLEDPGVKGNHIYSGPKYETPNVLIKKNGRQQFEVAVS